MEQLSKKQAKVVVPSMDLTSAVSMIKSSSSDLFSDSGISAVGSGFTVGQSSHTSPSIADKATPKAAVSSGVNVSRFNEPHQLPSPVIEQDEYEEVSEDENNPASTAAITAKTTNGIGAVVAPPTPSQTPAAMRIAGLRGPDLTPGGRPKRQVQPNRLYSGKDFLVDTKSHTNGAAPFRTKTN